MAAGTKKGVRRSEEERITELEVQIEVLKHRKAQRLARSDPALRHMRAAVKSIDEAMAATHDVACYRSPNVTPLSGIERDPPSALLGPSPRTPRG